jgi:uncharacterized Zn finger protein
MPSIADLVEEERLQRPADADAFRQGTDLAAEDCVRLETFGPLGVTARVEDTDAAHQVELRSTGDELTWSCTCQDGQGGACCRHAVAAAWVTWQQAPQAPALTA